MNPEQALLPGEDLVQQGMADLKEARMTENALLVLIAAPRLRALGLEIPEYTFAKPCEHLLYEQIEDRLGHAAHSYYNSLLRRIVSYTHALEWEKR